MQDRKRVTEQYRTVFRTLVGEGEGGMGKEGGEGFRMGNTCTPMVDSSQFMAKPIQCCKVR